MNKTVLTVIFTTSVLIAGCNKEQADVNDQDQKTIEQAALDSGIATDNIIFSEKTNNKDSFSIYESINGYGVILYVKEDKGWQYRGASGFEHSASGPTDPISLGASTWLRGVYSQNGDNTYRTVFIGEIFQPEIEKIILEVNNGKYNAEIITSNNRKYWYLQSDVENAQSLATKISAYSSQGTLIYENHLSPEE
ncbi:hypothetical protein M3172_12265 [Mesobacillus subterraneus]|uniref:hypothetical protein n=1 Tax=Mesobacillus subterraneus TaxID=285983 RepID=UPI00203D3C75|nr:hypothetical protein [Mesobacillus subterraneus]MCM3573963.1 hypothetical protein [Mesobacillus subterraneus]